MRAVWMNTRVVQEGLRMLGLEEHVDVRSVDERDG